MQTQSFTNCSSQLTNAILKFCQVLESWKHPPGPRFTLRAFITEVWKQASKFDKYPCSAVGEETKQRRNKPQDSDKSLCSAAGEFGMG